MNTKEFLYPTIYTIFGVTSDLAERKLLPALLRLYQHKVLPERFAVVGFSRREWSDEEFQKTVKEVLRRQGHKNTAEKFLKMFHFQQGHFDNAESYKGLERRLDEIDKEWGMCTNKLLHLSAPPETYPVILKSLEKIGLAKMCGPDQGWTRILVEKPFGRDIETAQKLDRLLGRIFKEEQIFRVDHYLGKETVQNILTFRFSNTIFEPILNAQYISRVEIKSLEKIDIGNRGEFYDGIGALRDMGQSHLLQMLALTAIDNPKSTEDEAIRKEKEKVLNALKVISKKNIKKQAVRGQYMGYRQTKGVKENSGRETYFKIKAFIDNQRWRGVPFILESGKALDRRRAEITAYCKPAIPCFCPQSHEYHKHQNTLTFIIQPDEGISIRFWAKEPGFSHEVKATNLSFKYRKLSEKKLGSYDKLIHDAIIGNRTLFPTTEEVMASWRFITPILRAWKTLPLHKYKKGSRGPEVTLNEKFKNQNAK